MVVVGMEIAPMRSTHRLIDSCVKTGRGGGGVSPPMPPALDGGPPLGHPPPPVLGPDGEFMYAGGK